MVQGVLKDNNNKQVLALWRVLSALVFNLIGIEMSLLLKFRGVLDRAKKLISNVSYIFRGRLNLTRVRIQYCMMQ